MDEDNRKLERRLLGWRDSLIAFATFGIVGIALFGLYADNDGVAIAYSVIGLGCAIGALLVGIRLGEHRKSMQAQSFPKDESGVSPIIAVILMVAITVILAASVYVMVAGIAAPQIPLQMTFDRDSDSIIVSSVNQLGAKWERLSVTGCTAPGGNETINAGDKLTDCSGEVMVGDKNANVLLYRTTF